MYNFVTNHHPRPVLSAFELTDREARDLDVTRDSDASYVRYRGWTYPLSDFSADWGIGRGTGLPSEFAGWDGFLADSMGSGLVIRFAPDGTGGTDYESVIVARFYVCECSEEFGPCAMHSDEIVSRVGSSNRSADELAHVFLLDALEILGKSDHVFARAEWEDIDAMRALLDNPSNWEGSWISEHATYRHVSVGLADALRDMVDRDLTDALSAIGLSVSWDDGFRIYRVTGGPLA